jgi:tetratricopeptide (TPR) repeat protein
LIDARTDKHLWSDTYDRSLDDIFAVQDEIAAAVVGQLKVALLGAAPKTKTADPKAYAFFLQARQLTRQGSPEALEQAVALHKQALAIDPTLAVSWAGLADCYVNQADNILLSNEVGYRLALEAANKALAIDPELAIAYARLGYIARANDSDLSAAARYYERALALDPANVDIIAEATGLARNLGRLELAAALAEYVVAHDPVNPTGHGRLGGAYIRAGRFAEGIASLNTSLRLAPGRTQAHYSIGNAHLRQGNLPAALAEMQQEASPAWRLDGLAIVYHALGKQAESDAALAELIAKYEKDSAWNIAYVCAYRGEIDRAFEWLEKSIEYRDPGRDDTAVTWQFSNLHKDPRWLPFLRKIGRAPEQVAAIKFDVKLPGR